MVGDHNRNLLQILASCVVDVSLHDVCGNVLVRGVFEVVHGEHVRVYVHDIEVVGVVGVVVADRIDIDSLVFHQDDTAI